MRNVRPAAKAISYLTFAAILATKTAAQSAFPNPASLNPDEASFLSPTSAPTDQEPASRTIPTAAALPNSPGWTLPPPPRPLSPCPSSNTPRPSPSTPTLAAQPASTPQPCIQVSPYHRFLNNTTPIPLTPRQKAYLAIHNFKDPFNLITIVGTAAFTVGVNSHTAYGPGMRGLGLNTGYSVSQDATGEFFGTFLIPSLLHEDPHYHREPKAPIPHRILHAVSRTVIAQHDDGRIMPNYAVLLTYPITAGIANLYVPGVDTSPASTAKRVATGLATDPIGNIITEFLPDIAKRINIRVIFVQRILNAVTAGSNAGSVVTGP